MPLHIINKVSSLVPEAGALIKSASLTKNLPTDSKEDTLLSALELEYMIKVAHTNVDLDDAERVCRAVDLYRLSDEVKKHSESMIKAASHKDSTEVNMRKMVSIIDNQLSHYAPNFEKVAEASQYAWDTYGESIDSDNVKLYSGAGTLDKEAAEVALQYRAKVTGNDEFTKIAKVITSTNVDNLTVEDNRAIISAISGLEKEAGYHRTDLYKDLFHTKKASIMIKLDKRTVPAETIEESYMSCAEALGSQFSELLREASMHKDAIEALPLGDRQIIEALV